MKENTKKGSCYLNGLAIFLSIIFVISIFIAADNAIPLQAATAKSQSTTVANRSKVKKDKWTTLSSNLSLGRASLSCASISRYRIFLL